MTASLGYTSIYVGQFPLLIAHLYDVSGRQGTI